MKFSLMLRKTHEAELDRAINIITEKNRVIAVKKDELKAEQKIKEVLTKRIEELQYKNTMLCEDTDFLQNKVDVLKEDNSTLKTNLEELEVKCKELDQANRKLIEMFNDANRKNWCNNESSRQLKRLSEEILESDKINKTNLSAYIYNISQYVGGGIPAEIKVIEDIEK